MNNYFEALEKAKGSVALNINEQLGFDSTADTLEKGRAAQMGEMRIWNGVKYQKTPQGWIPVKGEKQPSKSEGKKSEKRTYSLDDAQKGDTLIDHNGDEWEVLSSPVNDFKKVEKFDNGGMEEIIEEEGLQGPFIPVKNAEGKTAVYAVDETRDIKILNPNEKKKENKAIKSKKPEEELRNKYGINIYGSGPLGGNLEIVQKLSSSELEEVEELVMKQYDRPLSTYGLENKKEWIDYFDSRKGIKNEGNRPIDREIKAIKLGNEIREKGEKEYETIEKEKDPNKRLKSWYELMGKIKTDYKKIKTDFPDLKESSFDKIEEHLSYLLNSIQYMMKEDAREVGL